MSGYEFATRVNKARKADTAHKLSAGQGDSVLEALEQDPSLAADLGKHLYGDLVSDPQPDVIATPTKPRQILDIKDAPPEVKRA